MSKQTQKNLLMLGCLAILVCLVFPELAQASGTSGGGLPYEGFLNKIRQSVTGPVAYTMSIIGIIVGACTLIFGGDISGFFKLVVTLILVISILVGANNFLGNFFEAGAVIGQTPPLAAFA